MQRKLYYPGGPGEDKHGSSSEDTSYSGPVPVTPSLGRPVGVNTLLPHSICPALPTPTQTLPQPILLHTWKPPQKNNESKEQGFGKCSECQENHGFVSLWALASSSGKLGKFPAGYSLPFPSLLTPSTILHQVDIPPEQG